MAMRWLDDAGRTYARPITYAHTNTLTHGSRARARAQFPCSRTLRPWKYAPPRVARVIKSNHCRRSVRPSIRESMRTCVCVYQSMTISTTNAHTFPRPPHRHQTAQTVRMCTFKSPPKINPHNKQEMGVVWFWVVENMCVLFDRLVALHRWKL